MEFAERFKQQTEGLEAVSCGLCPGCAQCANDYGMDQDEFDAAYEGGEVFDEGNFSHSSCDTCGSHLGGDRYASHALLDGEIIHMESCVDCLMYIANGETPDTEE